VQSSPAVDSPVASGSSRPSSPTPPGGPRTLLRRRAAADRSDKIANARPASTRAAGAGGSTSTMLRMSCATENSVPWNSYLPQVSTQMNHQD